MRLLPSGVEPTVTDKLLVSVLDLILHLLRRLQLYTITVFPASLNFNLGSCTYNCCNMSDGVDILAGKQTYIFKRFVERLKEGGLWS